MGNFVQATEYDVNTYANIQFYILDILYNAIMHKK
jgi:hypothetical protein